MSDELYALYSRGGRPSIPAEYLLRAALPQVPCTIRSERLLVEQLDDNLLFRWLVGLSMEGRVWDHNTFSQNRGRPFNPEEAVLFPVYKFFLTQAYNHAYLSQFIRRY